MEEAEYKLRQAQAITDRNQALERENAELRSRLAMLNNAQFPSHYALQSFTQNFPGGAGPGRDYNY